MSDVFGAGTAIAGIVNAISSGIIHSKNFAEQKRQYDENMKWQREQFESLKEREDTAVQRRMADLKAAGLNPLMADGSNGAQASSTSYSGTEAAQRQYNSDILPTMLSAMLDSRRVKNEIAQTNLERERLHNQILDSQQNRLESLSRQLLNAKTSEEKDALIRQINATEALINRQAEALGININIARQSGEPVGVSPKDPTSREGLAKMFFYSENSPSENEPKGHAEPTKHDPNKYAVSQKNAPRGYGPPQGEQLKYAWYFDKKSGMWYRYGKLWYGE